MMLGISLLGSVTVVNASADEITANSNGHTFNRAWEETAYIDSHSKLVYGYNTFAINEDYSHCNKKFSQAYVENINGKFKANAALRTVWSKIEVTHAGNYVEYGAIYSK